MASTKFPFPPLPQGQVSRRKEPGHWYDLVRRDCEIIRWFVEQKMRLKFRASPLGDLIELYEKVDAKAPAPPIEALSSEVAQFGLHLTAQFERLAWAVRALYGNDAVEQIDASFVTREILDGDTKERNAEKKLPGGIGTLMFAGRLVLVGGGRVRINGNRIAGHDIRWVTAIGDLVLVERKDRSYEAGLNDTAAKRVRRVIDEIKKARIPNEPGSCRILTVGFQHLVEEGEMEQIDRLYHRAIRKAFKHANSKGSLPHFVVVEHLGLEPRTGGQKSDFFSPQAIHWNRAAQRMQPLLVDALGAKLD